jgi:hypothetical protein
MDHLGFFKDKLTLWSRVIFEKVNSHSDTQENLFRLWNVNLHCRVENNPLQMHRPAYLPD